MLLVVSNEQLVNSPCELPDTLYQVAVKISLIKRNGPSYRRTHAFKLLSHF